MKRSNVRLEEIAALENLARAFAAAKRAARGSAEAKQFAAALEPQLAALRQDVLAQDVPVGEFNAFWVYDPKPRRIHAPCFRERVLHHALIASIGPVLDRALADDTFACRKGRGVHRAVARAQEHARRFPWFGQFDVRAYFDSIDHGVLKALLSRKLKDPRVLALCARVIDCYAVKPGKGLPIGALTSQHFANYYLATADRTLLEARMVRGMVRYMDDIVFWGDSRAEVSGGLKLLQEHLEGALGLSLRPRVRIAPSAHGLVFCGFRVLPGALRLSLRRKRRYQKARERWERAYRLGLLTAQQLQQGYACALSITAHADAANFRKDQLRRRVPPEL